MFQFPGFAPDGLYIQPPVTPSGCPVALGYPIRRSPDQSAFDHSPELIAVYNVLLRLCTPRHPPCTLTSLTTFINSCDHTINLPASTMHLSEISPAEAGLPAAEVLRILRRGSGIIPEKKRLSSGADRNRTGNLRVANAALSRLSYGPGKALPGQPSRNRASLKTRRREWLTKSRKQAKCRKPLTVANPTSALLHCRRRRPDDRVGPIGFEPMTSSLSGTRSNQLSYEPISMINIGTSFVGLTLNSSPTKNARIMTSGPARALQLRP